MKKFFQRIRFIFNVKKFIPFLFDFFRSKDISLKKKAISLFLIIVYFYLPLDLIPDFIAFFGIIDDVSFFLFILQQIIKIAPYSLKEKHGLLEK
ncbi:YkvA family protein [Neobacillus sp. D3-1R]|uniref:YkvA family protein n=1 Tax=Neobacillus sp. D3-1R TaxID=3445778 RepID=UPI003F9F36DE